ncbi:HNH endonuclease signature motif containing protein [Micromonospora inaquosa]|uniref:HNH endonuclease n=1 Tax=Micromonospora inaquosa TaxID=2203716 RepID=A0A3N9WPF2_9ACTN|nr:HNH endonuclease signature motif containing protein [Micromonospora inaquosa]RQX02676.1 HNH endonuclease [Micromonospora inaquosa]
MIDELARAESAVATCADAAVWALSERDLIAALDATHRLQQRLAAVQLAAVRELDGRGTALAQGASSTAVWLRHRLRLDVSAARRLVGLAGSLDEAPPAVRDALASGAVSVEQARVIADTTATVSASAGAEVADKAVGVLVEWAGQFDPTLLRKLGTRILDHVAPDLADAAASAALAAEAARATRDRHVTISEQAGGRLRLSGTLDAEAAALLRAVIDPLSAPSGPDDPRCAGQRRHDALADVCRLALRTSELPENGGEPAQLVVTVDYDGLVRQLGAGTLDVGLRLAPDTVRRLACDAAILPAVLGGAGQVLDVGRQRRLVTGPLRRALVLRDGGCAFPGCDRPPRWCAAHHIRHWADGGPTSLDNAVLLCGHHHRHIHQTEWVVRLGDDGHPEFVPPAWLDPEQVPRRNHYHRRT